MFIATMAAQPTALRTARSAPAAPVAAAPVASLPARDADTGQRELARVLRWTLGIPTAALLSVAALYVLGALWTWGEIQDAGLVPTDVISFVPHAQLLGRGAQLVLLALLALPLPLAFAWLLHRVLPERHRPWGLAAPLARLVDDHRRLRRDLDELRGDADPIADPGRDKRVRRLHTRARTQQAVQRRTVWALRGAIGLALAFGLLVMSPARLAVALFGLWLVRRTKLSTLRMVAAVFAALVVAVAAERFTAPDPLPEATVRATNGALVKGPLVAATGDAWHVVVADRRVKSVPSESIAKASVYSESRLVRGPLGGRLIDLFR
jgi:hypothetical protein